MTTGIDLARAYYDDVVGPALALRFPGLPHAAGRLGSGSDVLGLDDAVSRDHDWGLRLTLLVPAPVAGDVDAHLEATLPQEYAGSPVRFATTWDPVVRHRVEVAAPRDFVRSRLGVDPLVMTSADWLSLTGQSVLEITAGPVFADTEGTITRTRRRLAWYPDDVWLAVLAAGWRRIGAELPFVGRTGDRGDDLGSRVVAARLAGALMHLAFLVERRWPPYPKWIGTVFESLPCATDVGPGLRVALAADDAAGRERGLVDAIEALHRRQRAVGVPGAGGPATGRFHDRPVAGLAGMDDVLADALRARGPAGGDPALAAAAGVVGGVEQWVTQVPMLMDLARRRRLADAALG